MIEFTGKEKPISRYGGKKLGRVSQEKIISQRVGLLDRGANGSDTDRIVVKPYPYPLLIFGYGYGSDIRRIHTDTDRIADIRRYIHKYFHNL